MELKLDYGFTKSYSTQKTLRFELQPIGKTLENIEKNGILTGDIQKADNYKAVKKIIDRYHRAYIEEQLRDVELEGVENCFVLYSKKNKTDKEKADFKKAQADLRKQIKIFLTSGEKFSRIDKKELIEVDLLDFLKESPEEQEIVRTFKGFATYFRGFHDNRRNMYSDEEKSSAIAYRLVNQNMLRFFDNFRVLEKAMEINPFEFIEHIESEFPELLRWQTLHEFFAIENYSRFLSQSGIDAYNAIIGGYFKDEHTKIKGINEYINLYNQKNKAKLGILKPLYKQILSDRTTMSFLQEAFEDDCELLTAVSEMKAEKSQTFSELTALLTSLNQYKCDEIFIKSDALNSFSKLLLGDWGTLKDALESRYDEEYDGKRKQNTQKYLDERKKYFDGIRSYSIAELSEVSGEPLEELYGEKINEKYADYDEKAQAAEKLLNIEYPNDRRLSQDRTNVKLLKEYLDSTKELQHTAQMLRGNQDEANKDEVFYGEYLRLTEALATITQLYDNVRNYITKKPYSTEKIKLNFDNATLLAGWDLNKEESNLSVILKRDGFYYLGIMSKKYNKIFREIETETETTTDFYEKMEYKLLPGPNKMLPKVFLSAKGIEIFRPTEEILDIYKRGSFKKGENFNLEDCHKLINYFKNSLYEHQDYSKFGFKFSQTQEYKDISEFYHEVEVQGYKLSFKPISVKAIDDYVEQGKLYLFRIWNKDFSEHSKGTPNLHTLYWKMLFDPRNLEDVVYKLNGDAELFYRKASISPKDMIIHRATELIENKNPLNTKKTSVFKYDLIKDRRYTVDKFQFHVPITLNFKAQGNGNLNYDVREYLKHAKDTYIIGIDRGERNLLYVCVIDPKGKIVYQDSLNIIVSEHNDGREHHTNYNTLLEKRETERIKAKQEWSELESIKELKEGYISQVVHRIYELMLKHKAIVVLEDLNRGFINGRKKVEKQVYRKFEKMLIEKLNYLVDKKADVYDCGGLLNALQLTSEFKGFDKLYAQSGMLFYVPPHYTSKLDPSTGFANLFNSKDLKYANIDASLAFWQKFDDIYYDSERDMFAFSFDYSLFTARAEGSRNEWTIYSNGNRLEFFRNKEKNNEPDIREIELTRAFKGLFEKHGIDYQAADLKKQILSVQEKEFQQELLRLFRITLQMRNSISNTDIDYIISPVPAKDGTFYDSREGIEGMPVDADANGAYNIARKGMWIIQRLKMTKDEELPQAKLKISNAEWLDFAQKSVL